MASYYGRLVGLALVLQGQCDAFHANQNNYLASLEPANVQQVTPSYQVSHERDYHPQHQPPSYQVAHDRDYNQHQQHPQDQDVLHADHQGGLVGRHYRLVDPTSPTVSSGKSFIHEAVPADGDSQQKVIVKLSTNLEALEREVQNYERIEQEAKERGLFVQVHGYLPKADPNDDELQHQGALVMEKGDKDLQTYIQKYGALRGHQLQEAAWSLARCVEAVHNSGMVWTELKAANFVVSNPDNENHTPNTPYDSMIIKAIDLESAVEQQNNPIDFSPEACPPEFLSEFLCGREPLVKVEQSFDIWSLGILFYKIATGKAYFNTDVKDGLAIALAVKRAEAEDGRLDLFKHVDIDRAIDSDLRGLIKWCLEMDPRNRPNIDQVLQHPFFSKAQPC